MVPNGWERTSFGQLAEFRNGLNFTKADQGEAIKIVGVADFKDHTSLSHLDSLGIINVSNVVKENDLIKSGDVLYVRSNGNKDLIGRCLFFPEVTEKLSFSGFTIRGRVTSETILPNYLALLSRSEIVKQQFSKNGGGTNISNLSQQILNDVVVPLPSIAEQRKIATILSTWDKAISTTKKLIETSKQQKKALMQQLLTGKKRLVNPETGKAFEGEWEEVKLTELCKIGTGKKDANDGSSSGKYPFFTCAKRPILSSSYSYDFEALLIAGNGVIGTTHYYKGKFEAYQRTYILSEFRAVFVAYLHHWIHFYLKRDVDREKQHGAMPYIKVGMLQNFKVKLGSYSEQQKIASALTAADKEIEVLETKLSHFKQEKKGLMQQLLTGKRRVHVE
ncbi:restriction endonuclease subunit S [Vibrio sp. 10N.261.46.A3]|jgi:type I restriction enzyme S subunit|uniref:restriction endonuclease subunit S n=1 Tax=Vibrio sp. 10N.261.46.A3 TaxID=3229658 RepID=UPI0035539ADA